MPGILALATALVLASPAAAQLQVQLQDGVVHGLVREAGSGAAVPFALVKIPTRDIQLFTSEGGRFSIAGLSPGEYPVEVRQIGFAPASFRLQVLAAGQLPSPPALVLPLTRQVLVLPQITVTATTCLDPKKQVHEPAAQAFLDQAITNGERLLAMAREYPLLSRFERLRAGLTASDSVLWFRWDTVTSQSERTDGYHRGRVMVNRFRQPAVIQYFTTSDIARKEFRDNHCLWVRGEEVIDSVRVVRIDFAPGDRIRSTDWGGALFLNATTGLLWRSEASLTRVPQGAAAGLTSARCEVTYVEIVPTLVHEKTADCVLGVARQGEATRRELWGLLTWEFTGRRPGGE